MKKVLILLPLFLIVTGFTLLDLDKRLRTQLSENKLSKIENSAERNEAKIVLGKMLFFDKLLSGNKDVSCATCHHPGTNSGDNLALAIGVGGNGIGENRLMGEKRNRIPRNSPEIFNRGMKEWHTMFWDSRVSGSVKEGFISPADEKLPDGLENILAVQAMFPVTSRDEMRGEMGDLDVNGEQNELALISNAMPQSIWYSIMQRLLALPEYQTLFKEAYPEIPINELGFQHAANSIAAFEIDEFTFSDSPFDQYLIGDDNALTDAEKAGAILFFGEANCSSCHSGNIFSDQKHYNLAVPQFGPGKDRAAPLDVGRYAETGNTEDRFAFRTPPLRNVSITGPWMHNGAFNNLEDVVKHHLDPERSLSNYETEQLPKELRHTFKGDEKVINDLLNNLDSKLKTNLSFSDRDVKNIVAFLYALTDDKAKNMSALVPDSVPSGIAVDNHLSVRSKNY
jgi:cytochrome c peroxidase